ncbi:MAG: hypothetical protein ABI876_11090, partial [Bacteroidota bacterium]
ESRRSRMRQGALEWQLLRNALPDTFYNLLSVLDQAGVLETASRYPIATRAANRGKNQSASTSSPNDRETPKLHLTPPYAVEAWEEMVGIGRQLLMRFLLEKALEENNERRVSLLQNASEITRAGEARVG